MVRAIANLEGSMHKQYNIVDKIRQGQHRATRSGTPTKHITKDTVNMDTIARLKTRVNHALTVIINMFEEAQTRDKVITEGLLDTMMGKNKQLICPRQSYEAVRGFFEHMGQPFQQPEILLTILEGEGNVFGRPRSRSTSTKKRRKRSSSRKSRQDGMYLHSHKSYNTTTDHLADTTRDFNNHMGQDDESIQQAESRGRSSNNSRSRSRKGHQRKHSYHSE